MQYTCKLRMHVFVFINKSTGEHHVANCYNSRSTTATIRHYKGHPQKVTVSVLNGLVETFETSPNECVLESLDGNSSYRITERE